MEQAEAVHHARRMTEAVATFSQNQGVAPETSRMEEFHNAAFSQAFEFIPNGAVAIVITTTEEEGLPMLVAVHGQQLYKLVFGEFDLRGDESPPTLCEMLNLTPENCTVVIETLYAAAAPPGRATRIADWNFTSAAKGSGCRPASVPIKRTKARRLPKRSRARWAGANWPS